MNTPKFLCLMALLLAQACHPAANAPIDELTGCDRFGAVPVLFVHGSGLNSSTWNSILELLRQTNYPQEYLRTVNLVPNDGDNVLAAETQIRDAMDELLDDANRALRSSGCNGAAPTAAAIVAHSMGAFSSRWYAANVAPAKVRALIALAGANHGTDALCGYAGAGNVQMCPAYSQRDDDENVQARLNGTRDKPVDETPYGIGADADMNTSIRPDATKRIVYLTLRIEPDEWIVPADSATLEGAGGMHPPGFSELPVTETSGGNFVLTRRTSHDDLPSQRDVVQFVVLALIQLGPVNTR